ncbi:unnamed protein product, partial [Polarella glacialis]
GKVFKLRDFACAPAEGSTKGVDYVQTMGKITLRYVFRQELATLSAADLTVQLSSWELKVRVEGRPEWDGLLAQISGDLHADVRRELSWWTLEKEADQSTVFTIELAKREHKAWNAVWKLGMSQHRKSHFGWSPATKASVKRVEDMLVKVKPGRAATKLQDKFVIRREDLCCGLEDGQDDDTAIYRIHLDKAALDKACETACLADLFAVDVMERHVKVFIRGDERSPILMGQLFDSVLPDKTRWEIVKALAPSDLEEEQEPSNLQRRVGQYNTCLQVTLVKAEPSKKHWPRLLDENEYIHEREAAPKLEELHQAQAIRPASPAREDRLVNLGALCVGAPSQFGSQIFASPNTQASSGAITAGTNLVHQGPASHNNNNNNNNKNNKNSGGVPTKPGSLCPRPPTVAPPPLLTADAEAVPLVTDEADPSRNLMAWRGRAFSQVWADGVIWKIFRDMGETSRFYVEFGTQADALECNTRRLREQCGWHGLLMDGGNENLSINLRKEFITSTNIVQLFAKYAVPTNLDLLSIDIDGNDWHIMRAILRDGRWSARVIIVEYNSHLQPGLDAVCTYKADWSNDWFDGYSSGSMTSFYLLA